MPAHTALRISALADLARQLRFAPPETARRQLLRAEALLADLDPDRNYPEDWLIWKVTGYRPDLDTPALLPGAALRGDLPAFIERLSTAARLAPADHPGWLTTQALCARWNVTRKTLERWRRQGLAARRVVRDDRRWLLLYDPARVEAFARARPTLSRASNPTRPKRITPEQADRWLRHARRYHTKLGWSRERIVQRLAQRTGRAPNTLRRALAAAEARSASAVPHALSPALPPVRRRFTADERAALAASAPARAARAARAAALSPRLRLASRASAHRLAHRALAEALRQSLPAGPHEPHPPQPSNPPSDHWLDHPAARAGLLVPPARTLADWVHQSEAAPWPDASTERARALAAWALRTRARAALLAVPPAKLSAAALDAIVTDLRWELRLRAALAHSEHRATLEAIRGYLSRPLERLAPQALQALVEQCLEAVSAATERFDPVRGPGRLAAPVGLAVSRALARWSEQTANQTGAQAIGGPREPAAHAPTHRAQTVTDLAAIALPDWRTRLRPWQALIDGPADEQALPPDTPPLARRALALRLGWDGTPPLSAAAAARALGITRLRLRRVERDSALIPGP
jgi:hypothetical protein